MNCDDRILILDFGSQYTQLIARRVRELGVYCEIYSCHVDEKEIREFAPRGIILSGGPESVRAENTLTAPDIVFNLNSPQLAADTTPMGDCQGGEAEALPLDRARGFTPRAKSKQSNVPVLGICYGMQTMTQQLGGKVALADKREFGYAKVKIAASPLFDNIEGDINNNGEIFLDVWMSHGDHVDQVPPGFKIIGSTANAPIAAMADESRHFYALQFHPEVSHTKQGTRILEKFILNICQCNPVWTTKNIAADLIANIRKQVGDEHVILGLSGGVDSSVVAALLHQAIGTQLTCIFVDHGLLRQNEGSEVEKLFAKHFGMDLIMVDASERFLKALTGVADPEQKRKICGKLFIDVFEEESLKIKNATWLAQGTIYPDVIESAASKTGKSHVIKSHHNVGGLPENMRLKLLEPLRELFKDEVRKLGLELGLPHHLIYRHPFPGPGLTVRILGAVEKSYADKLRLADAIFIEELRTHHLYEKVSQAFAVFLPVKSVGVLGDARHYDHVIALRAVETIDFMTAHWAHLPYDFLAQVSNRIINEVPGISRVVYDISGKPPATIEWE